VLVDLAFILAATAAFLLGALSGRWVALVMPALGWTVYMTYLWTSDWFDADEGPAPAILVAALVAIGSVYVGLTAVGILLRERMDGRRRSSSRRNAGD
jgi:hypothetical protein